MFKIHTQHPINPKKYTASGYKIKIHLRHLLLAKEKAANELCIPKPNSLVYKNSLS